MIKSKDYAEGIKGALDKVKDATLDVIKEAAMDACLNVVKSMVHEVKEIADQRHIKYDNALYAVLIEQENKWKAICRIFNQSDEQPIVLNEKFFHSVVNRPEFFGIVYTKYAPKPKEEVKENA